MRVRQIVLLLLALSVAASVGADPIPIIGYNIEDAVLSGHGAWAHTYDGVITSGATFDNATWPGTVADYTGFGSGTLNDVIAGATLLDTQLFMNGFSDGESPIEIRPTIQLLLPPGVVVDTIELYGGPTSNSLPGIITGVTVTFLGPGGAAGPVSLAAAPFGAENLDGVPVNDRIATTGTPLEDFEVSLITLSDFVGSIEDWISISEIRLDGRAAPPGAAIPVYVNAAAGDDSTGDGSAGAPFKTISRGLTEAAPIAGAGTPVQVIVSSGTYSEHITIPPHVSVRGADASTTFVESADASTSLANMGDNSALHSLTLRWANAVGVPSTLVEAFLTTQNTAFAIRNCVLDGRGSANSTGLTISGGQAANTLLSDSILQNLTTALAARDSGINVTRNEIRTIAGDAVVVALGGKQSGQNVPLLGDDADIAATALNRFRDIGGKFIKNPTGVQVNAEMNDWGIYDRDAVGNNIEGAADFGPIVGKGLVPGSVVASLYVGDTDALVDSGANPQCTIPALGLTAERDTDSGLFIFASVSGGKFSVQGTADGFASDAQQVDVSPASINAVNLRLTKDAGNNPNDPPVTPPSCGKTGTGSYALCGLIVWAAGRRRRQTRHGIMR